MTTFFKQPPQDWQRTPFKFLIEGSKNGAWGGEEGSDEIDVICVRVADFNWPQLRLNLSEPTIRSFGVKQFQRLKLEDGDLIIEKSGGGEKTPVGRVVMFSGREPAVTSNFVARLRPKDIVDPKFLLYLLAAQYMSGFSIQFVKQNTGIQNLDDAALFRSDAWIPDRDTQKTIADFLDRETTRIDQLIEKKQRLVALLKECRSARITAAVTGQTNATSHAKSGTPAKGGGGVRRLRHMVRIGPSPTEIRGLGADDEVTFAPMDAIADGLGGLDVSLVKSLAEVSHGSYNYFAEGDVLLAKVTPCFENGKKAISRNLAKGIGFATSEIHVLRPDQAKIDTSFLRYLLCSEDFRAEGMMSMTGAGGLRRVSENGVLDYRVKITDLKTQKAIADYLDRETARIDTLIEKTKQSINRLREHRAALITAAVTGQLDVTT